MKIIMAYRSTRNSSGVDEILLKIEDDKIIGEGTTLYAPAAELYSIGRTSDWRTSNIFLSREDAIDNYIALEESRIRDAQNAIDTVKN